jgi:hypothetical protein
LKFLDIISLEKQKILLSIYYKYKNQKKNRYRSEATATSSSEMLMVSGLLGFFLRLRRAIGGKKVIKIQGRLIQTLYNFVAYHIGYGEKESSHAKLQEHFLIVKKTENQVSGFHTVPHVCPSGVNQKMLKDNESIKHDQCGNTRLYTAIEITERLERPVNYGSLKQA